jgi:hypothetical protein
MLPQLAVKRLPAVIGNDEPMAQVTNEALKVALTQTGDEARQNYGLDKCESYQARAKQDDTGHGHSEKTFGSKFIAHGTPPIASPCSNGTTVPLHSQRVSLPNSSFRPGVMLYCNTRTAGSLSRLTQGAGSGSAWQSLECLGV